MTAGEAAKYAIAAIVVGAIGYYVYSLMTKGASAIQVTSAPPKITYPPAEAAQQDIQNIPLVGNPLAGVFNFGYQAGQVTGQALQGLFNDLSNIKL